MSTYRAEFQPEAWVNDYAIAVDPEGPTEWDCTAFVDEPKLAYLDAQARDQYDCGCGVLDRDDIFKNDPAAPQWIREWRGPFTIHIHREEA